MNFHDETLELNDADLDTVTGGDCPILAPFKGIVDTVLTIYHAAQDACIMADVVPRGCGL